MMKCEQEFFEKIYYYLINIILASEYKHSVQYLQVLCTLPFLWTITWL